MRIDHPHQLLKIANTMELVNRTRQTAVADPKLPFADGSFTASMLNGRMPQSGRVPSTSPRLRAPRLSVALTSVVVSGVQLEHFERPLNDDPICHVLVTHGFLSEKQAFASDSFYRDAVEFDRLGILQTISWQKRRDYSRLSSLVVPSPGIEPG
jgi:hypothetical protein